MLRKIFRAGNSLVVSLPRGFLEELQLLEGEYVSVELDPQQRQIVISPAEKTIPKGYDQGFAKQVEGFIEKYRSSLEALAK